MKKQIGCVIIILNDQHQVLLVLRDQKSSIPFPNTWNLLGGFKEEEESPKDCIHRELLEEIEVDVGEVYFWRKYHWVDCDEYIFWQSLNFDLNQVKLNEGQRLAYLSRSQIQQTQLAFECHKILEDFFQAEVRVANLDANF
ncbi:MAG: NUDIX domain-containing protein [Limnoraphis sp. WC205]|jgi:8-oxo-dGTP diphosphatase|nr:NUDIX domain-containing protein [Limnoraphis sp. WC205]